MILNAWNCLHLLSSEGLILGVISSLWYEPVHKLIISMICLAPGCTKYNIKLQMFNKSRLAEIGSSYHRNVHHVRWLHGNYIKTVNINCKYDFSFIRRHLIEGRGRQHWIYSSCFWFYFLSNFLISLSTDLWKSANTSSDKEWDSLCNAGFQSL